MLPKSIESVELDQMKDLFFSSRVEEKYWFDIQLAPHILKDLSNHYYIQKAHNLSILPYSNFYWDTDKLQCYHDHHRGKLSRYKIRKRIYSASNECFLELKQKNNKRKTLKRRISSNHSLYLNQLEVDFIGNNTTLPTEKLSPSLNNSFNRLTLIGKNFDERCTFDFDLRFQYHKSVILLKQLVVVEIKHTKLIHQSVLAQKLHEQGIYPERFSKYCIGMATLNADLKQNRWKHKLNRIRKIENR